MPSDDRSGFPVTGERTAERHWRLLANITRSPVSGTSHRGTDRRKALETRADECGPWPPHPRSPGNGPPKGIGDRRSRKRLAGHPSGSHRGTDRRKALETSPRKRARHFWRASPGNGPPKGIGDPVSNTPGWRHGPGRVTGERTAERHWRRVRAIWVVFMRCPCHRGTDRRKALETPRNSVRVLDFQTTSPGNGPPKGIGDRSDVNDEFFDFHNCHRGTDRRKALETGLDEDFANRKPKSPGNGPPKGIGDQFRLDGFSFHIASPGNGPPKGIGDFHRFGLRFDIRRVSPGNGPPKGIGDRLIFFKLSILSSWSPGNGPPKGIGDG